MTIVRERERVRDESYTGNMWRSLSSNIRVQLPGLLTRDNKLSRTADTTNKREGENEMIVKDALRILNDLPLEAEICAQWYEKEDMEYGDETISDQVWSEANRLMDKWELTDLRYQLDDAISQAKRSLEKKV